MAEMLYTWGNKYIYAKRVVNAAAGREKFLKRVGGSVWRTREEVERHLRTTKYMRENGEVFGVLARWKIDTTPNVEYADDPHPWHDLLVASPLVVLGSTKKEKGSNKAESNAHKNTRAEVKKKSNR